MISGKYIGESIWAMEADMPRVIQNVRRAFAGETLSAIEVIESLAYAVRYTPLRDASGAITGVIGVATDITESRKTEAQLSASTAEMEALFSAMTDVILMLDADGRYLDVPTAAGSAHPLTADLIGKTLNEVFPARQADLFLKHLRSALETQQTAQVEYSQKIAGEEFWFSASISPIGTDRVLWVARDITERRRNEQALRESEQRYRQLFDSIADICLIIDHDWHYILANQAASRFTGQDFEDLIGKRVTDLLPDFRQTMQYRVCQRVLEGGAPQRFISDRLLLPESPAGVYEIVVSSVPEGLLCIAHDISDRMRAEQALKESETRYHTLFEETRDAIYITRVDGAIVDFNQAALDMFGLTRADLAHVSVFDLYYDPADRTGLTGALRTRGAIRDYPVKLKRKDGTPMDCLITAALWRSADGELRGYQGIIRDVTEQKLAEEALRESEARFRAIFEGTRTGIALVDLDGMIQVSNPALREMLGYSGDELRAMLFTRISHPDDLDVSVDMFRALTRKERESYQLEQRCLCKDGEVAWARLNVSLFRDSYGEPLFVIAVVDDITEQRRIEAAEREQHALTEALHDIATVLNTTLDLDEVLARILENIGRVVPYDAATIMLVEEGTARVVGQTGYDRHGVEEVLRTLRFRVEDVPNLRMMSQRKQPQAIADLQQYEGWVDMQHSRWIRSYAGAPITLEGEVIGFINVDSATPNFYSERHAERLQAFADQAATAIKNARLYESIRRHAAELETRNAELDAFGHTVAHDLKAPLHVVLGYTSLMLNDYRATLDPEMTAHLKNIEAYAFKMNEMIENMLLLARLRDAEATIRRVNMKPVVEAALARFEKPLQERGVKVQVAARLPSARGYGPWVEEVWANLIENGIKYLGQQNTAPQISIQAAVQPDDMVRYQVTDNGLGIPKEFQDNLFKMFMRAHEGEIQGSGLGLSIVERIITRLGGQVGVESEVGKGSTFWFTLPK